MAITVGASTTSTSGTISKPAGLADGDVMVVAAFNTSSAPTAPAGWTAITAFNFSATYYFAAWYRVVPTAASEPASYSFSQTLVIGLTAFSGVDTTTPLDTTVSQSSQFSGVVPGVTTVTDGAWIVASAAHAGSADPINPPSGMTEQWEVIASANLDLATETRPTAGATGSRTFSTSGGTIIGGWMVALRPSVSLTSLAGSFVGFGQITVPAIREAHPLGAVVHGTAVISTPLAVYRPLTGTLAGICTLVGKVAVFRTLTGSFAGSGTLTGPLRLIVALTGDLRGQGNLAAALQVIASLAGQLTGHGDLLAFTITETHPLFGILAGTGQIAAGLAPTPLSDHVLVLAGGIAPVIGTKRPPQYLGNRTVTRT